MDASITGKENNILIYDRKRADLTGINDVEGFSDTCIILTCKFGSISVDGDNLKIESFDSDSGKLTLSGNIGSVCYFDEVKSKKKRRIFG